MVLDTMHSLNRLPATERGLLRMCTYTSSRPERQLPMAVCRRGQTLGFARAKIAPPVRGNAFFPKPDILEGLPIAITISRCFKNLEKRMDALETKLQS